MTTAAGDKRTGGCRCGAVRFVASGAPASVRACHCSDCRKASGAPYSVFVEYAEADIAWSGEIPSRFTVEAASRSFCGMCGSPLAYRDSRLDSRVYLLIGALDDPSGLSPSDHAFVQSKLDGVVIPEDVTLHERFSVTRPR
ncbi:GFA family protein [Fulvimarina sp. MAC8]|uniref:GFA family protein n=1 Tax=Fulvimarina sp. MAC8 TaxID=3162874 RepID=UPI0032EFBB26